jgi:hypothetical protein
MGKDLMVIIEHNPKHRVGEQLRNDTAKLQEFFFRHFSLYALKGAGKMPAQTAGSSVFHRFPRFFRFPVDN